MTTTRRPPLSVLAVLVAAIVFITTSSVSAFVITQQQQQRGRAGQPGHSILVDGDHQTTITTTTAIHMFGGLKDAFKNDDTLGKASNPGLKGGPNYNEQVTVNGKPVPGAVVGQKLTVVANKVRVKIPVNCQKGDCGTCTVKLNGRKVKACQIGLPSGKATIQTL